jgi:hypothetical protein
MPDKFFILILVKKTCKARVSKQVIMRKYSMAKYFNTIIAYEQDNSISEGKIQINYINGNYKYKSLKMSL